jgi:hypothetical protein
VISLAVLAAVFGCDATPPADTGATHNIAAALQTMQHQTDTLTELDHTVADMTPANVEGQRPKAAFLVHDAQSDNTAAQRSLGVAAKAAASDQKTIAELKRQDPIKVRLQWIGTAFLVGGVIALVAGIFLGSPASTYDDWLRSGGAAGIVVGLLVLCIAAFLTAIYWVVGGLLVVAVLGGGVWVYLHRSDILPWFPIFGPKTKPTVPVARQPTVPVAPQPANPVIG